MAVTINASTSAGLISTADTSGVLQLQTANTTAVTVDASQNVSLAVGTANGVTYLNGSKVLTSGSALVFDGTNLGLGVTPSAWRSTEVIAQIGNAFVGGRNDSTKRAYLGANLYKNSSGTDIYLGNGFASLYQQNESAHAWFSAASGTAGNAISFTQAMTLDADGDLGIGITSPTARLHIKGPSGSNPNTGGILFQYSTSTNNLAAIGLDNASGDLAVMAATGGSIRFNTNSDLATTNERARIDSSGNLLVGTTSTIGNAIFVTKSANSAGRFYLTSGTAGFGITEWFSDVGGTQTSRAYIRADGGLANYSANNVNLSDVRTKIEIKDAGSYLAKICAIPVRTFKYKNIENAEENLGVIAQEVEAIAPELVDANGFGETPEDGVPLKAIYQTDLQYALMKCIQEQQAIIESLKARLDAANL